MVIEVFFYFLGDGVPSGVVSAERLYGDLGEIREGVVVAALRFASAILSLQ